MLAAATFLMALVAACGDGAIQDTTPDAPGARPPACAPAPDDVDAVDCSRVARIGLAGVAPLPGGGVDLAVRLEAAGGEPLDARTYGACLRLHHPTNCAPLGVDPAAGAYPVDGASSALLVAPGSTEASAARARAVVEALLATRPAGERVGIFRWGAQVRQVVNFTTDRAVAGRLAARGVIAADEVLAPPDMAVAQVHAELTALSREAFAGVRSIVIVAPELSPAQGGDPLLPAAPEVAVVWERPPASAGAAVHAEMLAEALDAHQDAGLARLSWCGSGAQEDVLIKAQGSQAELLVQAPPVLPEEKHMPCAPADPSALRPYPERVELAFTSAEQRQIYRERVDSLSKDDFDVMLRLWQDGPLIEATAHLRGQSSLEYCERKSYAIDIADARPRRFLPGSATSAFYLIAMCLDDRYINQYTADALSARLGLFPLGFRFIELVVDGEHRGVYLFIEKPQDAMRRDNSRVRGIVRRRHDTAGDPAEAKYGRDGDMQALEDYQALMTRIQETTGDALTATAEASMDIDQYLRWIALMSLLGNGDYVDEVYFLSTETVDGSLAPADFYSVVGWDPDDLFSECHLGSEFALEDPHELLYCAESLIDHAMFADERMYARYVDVLASVLDQVTQEVFDATLDGTVAALDGYFRDGQVRAAMIELVGDDPEDSSYEQVMADIEQAAGDMKANFAARQAALREAIEGWRRRNE